MTANFNKLEKATPNWGSFYVQLGITGPKFLTGVSGKVHEYIEYEARATDSFWSGYLEEQLKFLWGDNPAKAVWEVVQEWASNVKMYFDDITGEDSLVPWEHFNSDEKQEFRSASAQIGVAYNQELIDELVAAAQESIEDKVKEAVAHLLIQGVVQPYQSHADGKLIRAIQIPWRKIIGHLEKDWSVAFQISPRQWEEIIAAAFHQEKYDEVILTPRSGDHGRDVIAIKKGVGSIRIINSVKAYKPGHLVQYDDIRALVGVVSADRNASKGIITTTSDFPPNILKDPLMAPLIPYRIELMNGDKLKRWLAEIAKK